VWIWTYCERFCPLPGIVLSSFLLDLLDGIILRRHFGTNLLLDTCLILSKKSIPTPCFIFWSDKIRYYLQLSDPREHATAVSSEVTSRPARLYRKDIENLANTEVKSLEICLSSEMMPVWVCLSFWDLKMNQTHRTTISHSLSIKDVASSRTAIFWARDRL